MAITFTIGGVTKTSLVRVDSLSITDQLNSRNTASFDLVSTDGSYRPTIGAEVVIARSGTTIFAGFVDDFDEEATENEQGLYFSVACVDYNAIADQRLVAEAYETAAQTLGDIVGDLVTTFLSGEGVTTTNVQTGPTIEKAIWNYQTVAEAFNDLADLTGYIWWIGYDKDLHFCARDTNAAPFALGDTSGNFRKMKVRRTREKYRNKQIIRAGTDLTASRTESFKGDGARKTFSLAFPVGKVPTVTVGGVSKTVGIRGIDSSKDWYWNKGSNEFTQDDGGTALSTSDTLAVTYQGEYPLQLVAQDDSQIASRQAVEGGTGIHEMIEEWVNVNSAEQAQEGANGLLQKFGRIPRIVTFETDTDGLAAGQLLTIENTLHDLSGTFLIESVSFGDFAGSRLRYQVKCLDGANLGGWEDFFRALARQGRRFVIRENEVVVQMRAIVQAVTCSDSLSVTTMAPESRVGYALVGASEVGA